MTLRILPGKYYWPLIMHFSNNLFFKCAHGPRLFSALFFMNRPARMLALLIICSSSLSGYAQSPDLPFQNGIITFQSVVELPGYDNELLFSNAMDFIGEVKIINQKKKENNIIQDMELWSTETIGGFLVYHLKSPVGEVRYRLLIEIKEEKYRYTTTDFIFYPYSRNRYGKFEREKWISKHLEEPEFDGHQKQWELTKEKTAERMAAMISDLKLSMARNPNTMAISLPSSAEDDW